MTADPAWDLILVGGGLANGLIAMRLGMLRPELKVLILESGAALGGNHTWSFHEADVTPAQLAWTKPLVTHRWPGYEVTFPGLRRRLGLPYCAVTSERFHETLMDMGIAARFGRRAVELGPERVLLDDGTALTAPAVVDGRGFAPPPHLRFAYQKFFGQEVQLAAPHGLETPILMDATVEQVDGYRFVYVLPFAADRLLVEDTCYSHGPTIDEAAFAGRIGAYARRRGWTIERVVRTESGVLPITLAGDLEAFWAGLPATPPGGLRAGLFHPTTGYSWAEAVRLADEIAQAAALGAEALRAIVRETPRRRWLAPRFFRGLNRVWFAVGADGDRWRLMQRFYGMPEDLIAHFYAGRLPGRHKLRLLSGRPPVAVLDAVRAMLDRSMPAGTV